MTSVRIPSVTITARLSLIEQVIKLAEKDNPDDPSIQYLKNLINKDLEKQKEVNSKPAKGPIIDFLRANVRPVMPTLVNGIKEIDYKLDIKHILNKIYLYAGMLGIDPILKNEHIELIKSTLAANKDDLILVFEHIQSQITLDALGIGVIHTYKTRSKVEVVLNVFTESIGKLYRVRIYGVTFILTEAIIDRDWFEIINLILDYESSLNK